MSWNLLQYFGHDMVTVVRTSFAPGAYDSRGEWAPGASTADPNFVIINPQPLGGEELRMLPEGEEASDFLVSWAQTPVSVRDNKEDSDEILWAGDRYKVIRAGHRVKGGFHSFTMARIREQR